MYNIKKRNKKNNKKNKFRKNSFVRIYVTASAGWKKKNEKKVLLTGATALTRTPELAHSMDKDLVRLSTAERAAPVWLNGT